MRVRKVAMCLVLGIAAAWSQAASATTITVGNAGFETNPISGFVYTPDFGDLTNTGEWTFGASGGASFDGYATAGSAICTGQAIDNQCAFLQGTGSFSQEISGFTAGSYTVSFYIEGRGMGTTEDGTPINGGQPITVTLGGKTLTFSGVGTVSPTSTSQMIQVISDSVTLTAEKNTLIFAGTVPFGVTDLTTLIDNVSIQSIPEPSTIILLITGFIGLVCYVWRKQK